MTVESASGEMQDFFPDSQRHEFSTDIREQNDAKAGNLRLITFREKKKCAEKPKPGRLRTQNSTTRPADGPYQIPQYFRRVRNPRMEIFSENEGMEISQMALRCRTSSAIFRSTPTS
jgi:hypothetical protein